jgi:alpha-tubulin suppressor-like RCC1 family protein
MLSSLSRLLPTALVGLFLVSASLYAGPGAGGSSIHTALLMPNGTVWTAGGNSNGEIGDGTWGNHRLTRVQVLSGANSIAVGTAHNLAAVGGQLFGWGMGNYGQLGDGVGAGQVVPTVLPSLSGVTQVAAGHVFSLALHADGTVHAFGYNFSDGVGDGTTSLRSTPVLVIGLSDAVAIAAGANHALAVRANGTVVAWGDNDFGKLGDGTTTTRLTPVAVTGLTNIVAVAAGQESSLALDSAGHVWAWGSNASGFLGRGNTTNSPTPIQIPSLSNVTAIAAGYQHAVALVGTTVWTWGSNAHGALGIGQANSQSLAPVQVLGLNAIGAIGAGRSATFAFAADNGVWGWGDGAGLGDGTTERRYTPIVLADGGGVWRLATPQFSLAGGNRSTPVTVPITSATPGATVRYTTNGAMPIESDAVVPVGGLLIDQPQTVTARAFKSGMEPSYPVAHTYTFSVLASTISPGTGTYTSAQSVTITNQTSGATVHYTMDGSEPTPLSAQPSGPITVSTQSLLKAKAFRGSWTPSSTNIASYSFNYGTLPTPLAAPGGGSYTTDQTVALSLPGGPQGAEIRYRLDGGTPGASSPLYTGPIAVSSTTTLKARAFHVNFASGGTLTAAYTMSAATPTFTLAPGDYSAGQTVAIATATPNATIRYTLNGATPTATDPIFTPGLPLTVGNYTLMAAAFRTGYTTSGTAAAAFTVTGNVSDPRVAAGETHTLVVKRDGTVWGTGSNGWGHLGDGTTNARTSLGQVAGLTGIRSIAAGVSHSAAVGQDGRLYTWGRNGSRQLGDGTSVSYRTIPTLITGVPALVAVAAGQNHTLALTSTGEVYAFGSNGNGQIGNSSQTTTTGPVLIAGLPAIAGIAAGDNHSLAWTSAGQLYAWGANGSYQLGDGSNTMRTGPVLITAVNSVAQAAAGALHTLVRTTSGEARAWGYNFFGQLADGTTTNRTTPTLIPSLAGVVAIGAGANHSLASTVSTTYTWGANSSWQLGDNANPAVNRTSPSAVAGIAGSVQLGGGTTHSAAVETGGAIWMWGGNSSGQIGTGSTTTGKLPVPIIGDVAPPTTSLSTAVTYNEEQTLMLSSATPGATVRYTLNGVDPVETDSIAANGQQIAITQNTTLKAKAWKTGLDPSAVQTFSYALQLLPPTITPPSGSYSQQPTIQMAPQAGLSGIEIRYTLDGNQPGDTSPLYGGPFILPQTATVNARAYKAGWMASQPSTSAYELQLDQIAPTITARVRPGVNAHGWAMGPATVTFICRDSGGGALASCSPPVLVTDETESQPFTGTATDDAGNSSFVNGVVKVDATPPVLTLTSPTDGLEVSTPFVTLTATASDAMSGLAAVRCNEVLATVSNGNVTCDVPLRAGRNPVVLQASDFAGHSTSIGIVVWRTVAVDRLTLSPQQMTLHEGGEVPLRLVNNMGRVQTGATWAVDAATVVEVIESPEPTLRALGPGTATVTATVGSLTAQSTITVVGATVVLAPGTTRWVVQATPGLTLEAVIYTHQTNPDVPEAVLVETAEGGGVQLRGIGDGVTTSVTPVAGGLPEQTMGDSFGGVLLVQSAESTTSLQRIGFTADVQPWRWAAAGALANIVQLHDGTIFATERILASSPASAASVVVLDGATGVLRARVPILTSVHYESVNVDCGVVPNSMSDGVGIRDWHALSTSDTYAVVTYNVDSYRDTIGDPGCQERPGGGTRWNNSDEHLLVVDRNGNATTELLSQSSDTTSTPGVESLAADAGGNFVVSFSGGQRQLFGVAPNGPVLPIGDGVIVSAEGLHVAGDGDTVGATDVASGQRLWTVDSPGVPLAFSANGRRAAVVRVDATIVEVGPDAGASALALPAAHFAQSLRFRLDGFLQVATPNLFAGIQSINAVGALVAGSQRNDQAQGTQRRRCLWTRSKYPPIATPVAFVTPSLTAVIQGWEAEWFREAVDEWSAELVKHRPTLRLRATTTVPSGTGELVIPVVFEDPPAGESAQAKAFFQNAAPFMPTRIAIYYSNWTTQASDPRPGYYRGHAAYLYRHEIGHILGLDHTYEYSTVAIMGTLLDIRHPEPGPDIEHLSCGEKNAIKEIYGTP